MIGRAYGILALVIVLAGTHAGAYLKGRGDGRAVQTQDYASERADAARALEAEREHAAQVATAIQATRDAAQQGAADAIAQIQIQHQTIRQRVEREIVEKPVFRDRDCDVPDSILQLVNAALANRAAGAAELVDQGGLPSSPGARE